MISVLMWGKLIASRYQNALYLSRRSEFFHVNSENSTSLLTKKPIGFGKVEKIFKGSLDSIPSPSPLMKIQIMGGKVCLRCKGKTLPGVVFKSLLTMPGNVLLL